MAKYDLSDLVNVKESVEFGPQHESVSISRYKELVEEKVKERLKEIAGTVKFESGKSVLTKDSYKLLDEVAQIMSQYPAYSVSVEGHTDASGSDAINDKLSNERAKVCADYIISKGIDTNRVSSVGFGSKNPIADNTTAAGKAKNRRTEFNLFIKD